MLKSRFRSLSVPAVLLLLAVLSYGLLIPWLGFYWDDWPFAWLSRFLSLRELAGVFSMFRPFDAPFFLLTIPILRDSPLAWQLYGLAVRLGAALAVWWSMRQIWPGKSRQVAWVAMVFLVFPGFGQQWIAFTHANQEQVPLIMYLLSLGFTARAARAAQENRRAWVQTSLALGFMALGLFPSEYFIGLEFLRPLILLIALIGTGARDQSSAPKRLFHALLLWLPYLLLWLLNAAWLYAYQRTPGYISYGVKLFSYLAAGPKAFVLQTIETAIQSLATAAAATWNQGLQLFLQPLSAASTWLTLALVGVAFAILLTYLLRSQEEQAAGPIVISDDTWALQAIGLGVLGILLGRLPSWAAGLPFALEFPWDRFLQSMMLGASLLSVGLLEYLLKTYRRKAVVLSLFLALAVGAQFNTANTFRRDWDNQRTFFWQMAWRAPGLKTGTAVITHELPLKYVSDNSLIAPLNWTYAPDFKGADMPYLMVYSTIRLKGPALPSLRPNTPISSSYRTRSFHGSTSQAVVIYDPSPGCLRVLDTKYTGSGVFPGLPYLLSDAIPLSDLSRIEASANPPAAPPIELFGKEPAHTWCYYFEKADLARQVGDWQEAARLEDEARVQGLQPELASEWLPFLEARAHLGDWVRVEETASSAIDTDEAMRPVFCSTLKRMSEDPGWSKKDAKQLEGVQSTLECTP